MEEEKKDTVTEEVTQENKETTKEEKNENKNSSAPTARAKTKKDTVEVEKDTLKNLLDRVEKLESDNEVLREASDKGRLGRIESLRNQGKLVKSAKVSFIDGSPIIGWRMKEDDVYIDQEGKLHERQIIELYLEGKKTPMAIEYKEYIRRVTKEEGEIIRESKDQDGNLNVVVQFKDGREIALDIVYVN